MNAPQLSHINPQDSKYLITQTGRSPSATWAAGEKNIRNQSSKVTDDVPIFSETWQLWILLWINCGKSENKITWVWCTWICQFEEQRLESHVCFPTQNDPNESSSQCCFFSMTWLESAESFWHDSLRADLFDRKPLHQCNSVIRLVVSILHCFKRGDPWPQNAFSSGINDLWSLGFTLGGLQTCQVLDLRYLKQSLDIHI